MIYNTAVPIVYRSFIGVPNIVLMNNMACYVYRNVRFGVFKDTTITSHQLRTTLPSSRPRGQSSGIVFGTHTGELASTLRETAKSTMDVVELEGIGKSGEDLLIDAQTKSSPGSLLVSV